MRVIMTGGGTGGHVNPALAIADTIRQNEPDSEIIFVGTRHGKETELVPRAGYRLEFVEIQGISRSLSPKNIKTAWYILTAPRKAERLIREFRAMPVGRRSRLRRVSVSLPQCMNQTHCRGWLFASCRTG